ncbi:hypothetical protein BOTBODRAFT_338358 [Botryobasidium botryosum FD-172 SS1]|uniref:Uncharacterized protein n=1 Tax=Botryobasidium botryosum (strain FD-172 SS1) TaxID=930990 RepID=A0A067MSW5_BOTB1|nr:hypothetical protein BOTBODRAFT_338358 [Botryobasidium botryosum FD-172 SS1]
MRDRPQRPRDRRQNLAEPPDIVRGLRQAGPRRVLVGEPVGVGAEVGAGDGDAVEDAGEVVAEDGEGPAVEVAVGPDPDELGFACGGGAGVDQAPGDGAGPVALVALVFHGGLERALLRVFVSDGVVYDPHAGRAVLGLEQDVHDVDFLGDGGYAAEDGVFAEEDVDGGADLCARGIAIDVDDENVEFDGVGARGVGGEAEEEGAALVVGAEEGALDVMCGDRVLVEDVLELEGGDVGGTADLGEQVRVGGLGLGCSGGGGEGVAV